MNEAILEDCIEEINHIVDDIMGESYLDLMSPKIDKIIFAKVKPIVGLIYSELGMGFNDIDDIIHMSIDTYFGIHNIHREIPVDKATPLDKDYVTKQLNELRSLPQPTQNTEEWLDYRWTRLTASSAWKALASDAMVNSLIYSKCKPIDKDKVYSVNVNSATHHGHKFEPVSIKLYEDRFNTTIEEFGCIPDSTNCNQGASPDGINVKSSSDRYGFLLEVKNPVSRIPTGKTKLDYWVQMQFQMHVIKFHTCDFLETCFKEYDDDDAFNNDGTFKQTVDGKKKGIIVCFNDGKNPSYAYPPVGLSKKEFDYWYDTTLNNAKGLTWINNTYWYLDMYSCVTVEYNKKWFDVAQPYFTKVWDTIEKERVSGYEHRAPKKRVIKNADPMQEENKVITPIITLKMRPSSL